MGLVSELSTLRGDLPTSESGDHGAFFGKPTRLGRSNEGPESELQLQYC